MKSKPTITEDLSRKANKAQAGEEPNPIFVCLAGAGYETTRALRLFMGEVGDDCKKQFSELPATDRAEMVDDAMQVVAGATPPDLYKKYSRGVMWESLDPVERVIWTTFAASVNLQLEAIKHIGAAVNANAAGGDNVQ